MRLVDVVNFNADGSCLPAEDWIGALRGGSESMLCDWLRLYVEAGKKVSLGWVGATLADVARLNPEAIALVNTHQECFEILLRPFAHDVALLRSVDGFELNASIGISCIGREFDVVTPLYLPPEFMLTASGIHSLSRLGVEGVFINARRFGPELGARIPDRPYRVRGVLGSELDCLPVQGELTDAWLAAIHGMTAEPWNSALAATGEEMSVTWRDGETFLFLPDGIRREQTWLREEDRGLERVFAREVRERLRGDNSRGPSPTSLTSYPPHSFTEWSRESRMLGYLGRIEEVERHLSDLSREEIALWFQAINSDVLSAVEKDSPVIRIRNAADDEELSPWRLLRSDRGFEGEEYLLLLEKWRTDPDTRRRVELGEDPHLVKLRARMSYLLEALPA